MFVTLLMYIHFQLSHHVTCLMLGRGQFFCYIFTTWSVVQKCVCYITKVYKFSIVTLCYMFDDRERTIFLLHVTRRTGAQNVFVTLLKCIHFQLLHHVKCLMWSGVQKCDCYITYACNCYMFYVRKRPIFL